LTNEKIKLDHELHQLKNDKERDKIEKERELLIIQQKLKQTELELQDVKLSHEKILQEMKIEGTKFDHEVKKEGNVLDLEKARVTNYYSERSFDRKDTSEMIKIIPGIIGGAIGIVGTMVALKLKFGIIGLTASAAGCGPSIAIAATVAVLLANTKIFRSFTKTIAKATVSVGKSLWNGTKEVGSAIMSGVRSVGSFVSDTFSSMGRGISNLFSF
jgi:hypothetical protein